VSVPFGEAEHSGVGRIGQQRISKKFIFFSTLLFSITYKGIFPASTTKKDAIFNQTGNLPGKTRGTDVGLKTAS